jgi:mono/diheme cytochrome c family protein
VKRLALLLVLVPVSAPAKQTPADGRAAFTEKCAMCHRGRGMGSVLLARRMDPAVADLEKRTDLDPAAVKAAVRGGVGNMPRISRGELSDAELDAIAAYLTRRKNP